MQTLLKNNLLKYSRNSEANDSEFVDIKKHGDIFPEFYI